MVVENAGQTASPSAATLEHVPAVYACIAAVSRAIAKTGIAKARSNEQQHYRFRGIDDVYNALAPLIAAEGLVIIPRILSRTATERQTKSGGLLIYVVVEAEFDFYAASDGSKVTARSVGEAMDSADKATNKAMSAAYKYTAFQTFCIPTEGNPDADATTLEVAPAVPAGFDDWIVDMEAVAMEGTALLLSAWKASPLALRKFLTDTQPARWERIKTAATKVSVTAE